MGAAFVNLPVPAGNGAGAAVDVSAMGALKSVVIAGTAVATFNIEVNNTAAADGSWAPLCTITNRGVFPSVLCAAKWMRVRVSGYQSGAAQVDVGSSDGGTNASDMDVPAATGAGAALDVSALGTFKTVTVGGVFTGAVIIEASEDGNTHWAQVWSFNQPGMQSALIAAHHLRVQRTGVTGGAIPKVAVAGTDDLGGGASSGGPSYTPLWTGTVDTPDESVDLLMAGSVNNRFSPSRDGSIAGISVAIPKYNMGAGSLTIEVLLNDAVLCSLVITPGSPFFVAFARGTYPYAAGDLLRMVAVSDPDLDPVPVTLDAFFSVWE